MGMDVYGKAPKSERGRYFRNNVWSWHPLAMICKELAPEIAKWCKDWHSNNGDGLDRNCARKLGKKLDELLKDGTIERSCRETRLQLRFGRCPICWGGGSIQMTDQTLDNGSRMAVQLFDQRKGEIVRCDVCRGVGFLNPASEQHYEASEANVREFAAFCTDCGGFEIR